GRIRNERLRAIDQIVDDQQRKAFGAYVLDADAQVRVRVELEFRHSPTLLPCPHEVVRSRDSRRSSEGCFGFPSRVSGQQLGPQAQRQQMRVNEPRDADISQLDIDVVGKCVQLLFGDAQTIAYLLRRRLGAVRIRPRRGQLHRLEQIMLLEEAKEL